MKKKKFKNQIRKKIVGLILATSMFVTSFGNGGVKSTAFAETVKVVTVSSGAVSEQQEVVTTEKTVETAEETAAPKEKVVMKKSALSVASTATSTPTLPPAVDNSTGENGKYFPKIGWQGQVGACLHWAMEYYIQTYSVNKYFDRETKESNTFSPKWVMALGHRFASVSIDRCPLINFEQDSDFLYKGECTYADCEADWMEAQKYNFKPTSLWNNGMGIATPVDNGPDSKSLIPIKTELKNGKVLYLYTFYGWLDGNQGKIDGKLCQENKDYDGKKIAYACQGAGDCYANGGVHAMTIVGYNDKIGYDINGNGSLEKAEMGAFLVANQHGTWSGNEGFIWVSYDALNEISNVSDKTTPSGYVEVPKGKTRVTFAATIDKNEYDYETIAKEELDYYIAVTLRAKDRNINMAADGTNVKIGGSPYTIWASNLVKYNLAGDKEGKECEATMILACDDLSDGKSHYLYIDNTIGKDNAYQITIKNVKFVDNVHGKTYGATKGKDVVNAGETTKWYLNRDEVLPHFKKIKLKNTGVKIEVTAAAEDEVGDISYALSYRSENGDEVGVMGPNKTGKFSFVPKTEGYYRVKVTATDANKKSSEKTKLIKVDSSFKVTDFDWDLDGNESTANASRKLTASTLHGKGTVQYKFAVINAKGEHTTIQDYSTEAKASWTPSEEGIYSLIVYAKDNSEEIVDSVKAVTINPDINLESFTIDKPSPQKIGTTITATAKMKGGTGNKKCTIHVQGGNYKYGDKDIYFKMSSSTTGSWTPDMDGTYTILITVSDDSGRMKMLSGGKYVVNKAQQNSTTIYYSGYSTPYIHYMIEGRTWTTVPGVKMEASSEKQGYTHKITIPLGEADKLTACFNNGNGSWDSKNGANYTFQAGTYGVKNQNIYNLGNQEPVGPTDTPQPIAIKNVTIDKGATVSYGETANIKVEATGGDGKYTYSGMAKYDSHGSEFLNYVSGNTLTWKPKAISDTYTLFISVTDGQGQMASTTLPVKVVDAPITTVYYNNTQWTTAYAHYRIGNGDWTNVPGVKMEYSDKSGYKWMCAIPVGSEKDVTVCFNNGNNSWDSKNGSNYKIGVGSYGIKDGIIVNLEDQVITPTPPVSPIPAKHKVVVYYANANFSNAYIHYKVNGQWTQAPGVRMSVSDAQSGYKWRYEIDLGNTTSATVCFNNGSGSWDSKNGANYEIKEGVVGIKDGKQETLQDGMHWESFTADKQSPQQIGTAITLKASFVNAQDDKYNSYSFYVTKDGQKVQLKNTGDNTAVWTPATEGNYTLTAVFNYFNGNKYETTMSYEIKESNLAVVYYNTSWSKAYVHYGINGKWTNAPGVAMKTSDKAGYKWMYTIDLGNATQAQVCFNNGNNSWDSQNGKNYTVVAGENIIK